MIRFGQKILCAFATKLATRKFQPSPKILGENSFHFQDSSRRSKWGRKVIFGSFDPLTLTVNKFSLGVWFCKLFEVSERLSCGIHSNGHEFYHEFNS